MSGRFAIVTAAASEIGAGLAHICAGEGFDLLLAADCPEVRRVADRCRLAGGQAEALEIDLATAAGVDQLYAAASRRPVDVLIANAGHGLGDGFLDRDVTGVREVIDTNIIGNIDLIQRVVGDMRSRGEGRVLITGASTGFLVGTFGSVNDCTKASLETFTLALRGALADTAVTVTCLVLGSTDPELLGGAGMIDMMERQSRSNGRVVAARIGFDAMMRGEGNVGTGSQTILQSTLPIVTPIAMLASQLGRRAS